MSRDNKILPITQGIILLIVMHTLTILIIFAITSALLEIYGSFTAAVVSYFAIAGLFILQLLYVIPICIWLKRKGKNLMMKTVIYGAVITALVNILCNLIFFH